MQNPENSIYYGDVFHERHTPFVHRLKYRVFSLWLDIDALPALDTSLKWFSFNKWNIFSVHNKDHAARDGSSIRPWIEKAGEVKNIDLRDCKIFMLSFPRVFGYVFNPLTIYFCYRPDGTLKAILYQVKNTFKEQHGYLFAIEPQDIERFSHSCDKIFHVSPFIEMDCRYEFRLDDPSDHLNIAIHQFTKTSKILTATWNGEKRNLTDKQILRHVLRHPLMTFKIIVGIHWEALKLFLKGAKYIKKPPPPESNIS